MIENPTKTPEGTPQGTPIEVGKETCPTKTPKGIDAQKNSLKEETEERIDITNIKP